jgi:cytochrome P450
MPSSFDRAFRSDPIATLDHLDVDRQGASRPVRAFGATTVFCSRGALDDLFDAERDHLRVFNTRTVNALFGDAVFNLEGDDHARARRAINGGIGTRAVADIATSLGAAAGPLVAGWDAFDTIEIWPAARDVTFRMSHEVLLGAASVAGDDDVIRAHLDRFVAGAKLPSLGHTSRRSYWQARRSASILRDAAEEAARSRPDCAVNRIASALGRSDRGRLGDHVLALLVAGQETTASLITWFLVELVSNPTLVAELRDEANMLGDVTTDILVRDHAPKAHAALLEVERRHSPNVIALREVVVPFDLGRNPITPGWLVGYSPAAGSQDAHRFPDPARFDPTRFRDSEEAHRARRDLLTFGRGSHACPGRRLAEAMTLLVVTEVVRRYTLRPAPGWSTKANHLPVKTPQDRVRLIASRNAS